MSRKLPHPNPISPEEIRAVFETHGFKTVGDKTVSIEVYDLLVPLLTILQNVQWWGELCRINGIQTGIVLDDPEFEGISLHAASQGQQAVIASIKTIETALNMPRSFLMACANMGPILNFALNAWRIPSRTLSKSRMKI